MGVGRRIVLVANPMFSYLILVGDQILLSDENPCSQDSGLGNWCGEWGGHIDQCGCAVGVRLMFLSHEIQQSAMLRLAKNISESDGDVIVYLTDPRLPQIEGMPFFPIYRAYLPDGREILQLDGFTKSAAS